MAKTIKSKNPDGFPYVKEQRNIGTSFYPSLHGSGKNSKYLFPSFGDKTKHLSAGRWKHIFREKICKPSGFYRQPDHPSHARTTSYSLRHSRGTELLEETGDLDLVATMLGHKDTRVTRGYTHFTKSRWEKMIGMVNKDLNIEKEITIQYEKTTSQWMEDSLLGSLRFITNLRISPLREQRRT